MKPGYLSANPFEPPEKQFSEDPRLDNEIYVQARMYSARELYRLYELVLNRKQLKPYEINCGD
jgi:hypothetical protein